MKNQLYVSACAAALLVTPAFAQDTNEARQGGLDEIVVTAERRETSLQKTPVAVSALGGEFIRDARIDDVSDVTTKVPGLVINYVTGTQAQIALRGAGSQVDGPFADQAVAIFVDDVFIGEEAGIDFDLFDIERIEVLRGPQGTLFGRNVVGGAVNIITRSPSSNPDAVIEATYGRFDQLDIRGMVSGPLILDTLAAQLSFSSKNSDGAFYNATTGNRVGAADEQSMRLKFRFTPNDRTKFDLTGNYSRNKGFGAPADLSGDVGSIAMFDPSPNVVNMNVDGGYNRKTWGVTGRLEHDFNGIVLTSISAYREGEHETVFDTDATAFRTIEFTQRNDIQQFSQELRLTGESDALQWVAGLYYLNLDITKIEDVFVAGAPGSILEAITGGATFPEQLGQEAHTRSYAAYAQGTYSLTDRLRATAGLRYSYDKKFGRAFCIIPGIQCGEVYDVPLSESWDAFTPKFTLDYDLADDALVYATVSRGFKGGGFPASSPDPASAVVPYNPEYAWNYEIGLKSRFLDNRLQANITAFRVEYSDLQTQQLDGARIIIRNAGKAHVNGIELELAARPVPQLDLFANYAYLDAVYDRLVIETDDFSGNRINFTPKHSLSAGGSYRWDFANDSSIVFRADVSRRSKVFHEPSNPAKGAVKYDALANASLTYGLPGGSWEVALWGKNIFNERYQLTALERSVFLLPAANFLAGDQVFYGAYNEPSTYGVTIRWKM